MINCDLFIKGAEEIDRKRKVISRVINSIVTPIKKLDKPGGISNVYFSIPLPEKIIRFRFNSDCSPEVFHGGLLIDCSCGGRMIPARSVPILYNELPKIVEMVDKQIPGAGVKDHFRFFIEQAPTE